MPNGYDRGQKEWDETEALLRELDPMLRAFADENRLEFSANGRAWPDRNLERGGRPSRLIQIYLDNSHKMTFNVWVCASEDRGKRRYWKKAMLREGSSIDEIREGLKPLLDTAWQMLESWTSADLEFATRLS